MVVWALRFENVWWRYFLVVICFLSFIVFLISNSNIHLFFSFSYRSVLFSSAIKKKQNFEFQNEAFLYTSDPEN